MPVLRSTRYALRYGAGDWQTQREPWVILETRMPPLLCSGAAYIVLWPRPSSRDLSAAGHQKHSPAIRVSCSEELQVAQSRGKQVVYTSTRNSGSGIHSPQQMHKPVEDIAHPDYHKIWRLVPYLWSLKVSPMQLKSVCLANYISVVIFFHMDSLNIM